MPACDFLIVRNGEAARQNRIPLLSEQTFRARMIGETRLGARIAALFGAPPDGPTVRLYAVLAHPRESAFHVFCMDVRDSYRSLTPECAQAHWFEREIAEQWGVKPEGHPWLKPIRFHRSYRKGHDAWGRGDDAEILPCVTDYFRVDGEQIHEVAVGPVHAGVIEPGHFRFQCHGEHVFHLEISLGYQHRGAEKGLWRGPDKRTIHQMETVAGDTTIGHALAYCRAVEALGGVEASPRAQALRAIALELERLANHTGDLGAMANDVGYLPTASFCGRIRGDFLNMTALICGNRFGRGLVRPGGAGFDLDAARLAELSRRLDAAARDVDGAVGLLWKTSSVLARFEGTGTITSQTAADIGLVGVAARASGLARDARVELPYGPAPSGDVLPATQETGDVFARAFVRWMEIESSITFIRSLLTNLGEGTLRSELGPLAPDSLSVSMTEGWRGEICHVALTDPDGRFSHYKIVDPSFHNWFGLALALRNQQISDFPLCNKSFNLSYCGHDL